MSDVVRDFLWSQKEHGCYGAVDALVALDAERVEHARQVEDIKFRCTWLHSDLEQQVADLKRELRDTNHTNNMCIVDLRQRISELEAQKCGCGLLDEEEQP